MDFHIGFLNKIPVIELFMAVVLIVGAIYYFAVQRKKPWTPVVPPDEDLSGIASAASDGIGRGRPVAAPSRAPVVPSHR